ncbi:MAG: transketolase, partial [Candidatus Omnitrophica bacterium CG02_land_8_20_14_3_00__42_8]
MNTYYKNIAAQIRKDIVMMHAKANSSHIGSAFSCVDLLVALYFDVIKTHSKNKKRVDEDKFILSKGHAVSALYATLAQKGVFSKNLLKRYCINGTRLPGHATRNAVKGLDVSTGSLGHGLSVGAGMALAAKHD